MDTIDAASLSARIARVLADLPGSEVARHDEEATVIVQGMQTYWLVVAGPPDALTPRLRAFVAHAKKQSSVVSHLLVVGGGPDVPKAMKRAAPWYRLTGLLGLHWVASGLGDSVRIESVRGKLSKECSRAISEMAPTAPPLDADEAAGRIAAHATGQAHEHALAHAMAANRPWATIVIGVVCVALFGLGQLWSGGGNFNLVLLKMGANFGDSVKAGEVWRLLASAFLHGNFMHLAFNMIALAGFGPLLEAIFGVRRFVLLYVLTALGGSLASAMLRSDSVLSVGASGAIWGLMAAGVALALRPRNLLPPTMIAAARNRTLAPLALNAMYSFTPGVDLLAHAGGGVVGFVLVYFGVLIRGVVPLWSADASAEPAAPADTGRTALENPLTMAAVVAGALALGSVGWAIIREQPWQMGEPPTLARIQLTGTSISVQMPSQFGSGKHEATDGLRLYEFGDLEKFGTAFEFVVNPLDVVPDDLTETLEAEKVALETLTLDGFVRNGPAQIVTLATRQFATARYTAHGVRVSVQMWATIMGADEVIVRAYQLPNTSDEWAAVPMQVAASLEAAP